MGTEASARLVSELVILCLISTLCLQLGSEFKYQSIAETLPELATEEGNLSSTSYLFLKTKHRARKVRTKE
ncbi:hypothetical protein RchiOBHm_Chr5g0001261 [Rosa chinensis]|uniref:Uncharacterized protein n=1 Tax=Rosa chinensis TaxID=74649 RepID=A0A2P6Q268_ROSCH|nr:hypothetical protein RchiOBHm_Chr5g0001261 [Rosa chinensis]